MPGDFAFVARFYGGERCRIWGWSSKKNAVIADHFVQYGRFDSWDVYTRKVKNGEPSHQYTDRVNFRLFEFPPELRTGSVAEAAVREFLEASVLAMPRAGMHK